MDKIRSEPWTNDQLALVVRLSALLHERWRTDRIMDPVRACTVVVSIGQLQDLAGVQSARSARARAEQLPLLVTCSVVVGVEHVTITWNKWAEEQGLLSEHGGKRVAKNAPSASSVPRPSQEKERRTEREGRSAWLNVLSKELGTDAEKSAFLASEIDRIQAEALVALPADRAKDPSALAAKTRSLIVGWYRQRRRNPHGPNGTRTRPGGRQTVLEAGRELVGEIIDRLGDVPP
jgi:hypothetical protein